MYVRRFAVGALLAHLALTGCTAPAAWRSAAAYAGPAPAQSDHAVEPASTGSSQAQAAVALQRARHLLLNGAYGRAMEAFAAIQATAPGADEAAEAAFGHGEAALADDQFLVAEDSLRRFLAGYPGHSRRPTAWLMLGRALEGRGDGGAAVAAYHQYVQHVESVGSAGGTGTVDAGASVADLLHLRAANIYFGAGRIADGWAELALATAAADRSGSAAARARVYEALGQRYLEAGDRARAAAAWQTALDGMVAADRPARAIADLAWKLAGIYQGLDEPDAASALRWRIVGEWPRTLPALNAMNDLGADAIPAFLRGLIAYSNQRWAQAIGAFDWYLTHGAPEGRADEARYYRAMALTRLGRGDALAALDGVADRHPQSQWAAEALWEAGSLLLRQGDHPAAVARFERLAVGHPLSRRRGQALYWAGKLLPELGNVAAGHRYMEAAAAGGYEDFYTFRARAALRQPPPAPKPLEGQEHIGEQERAAWAQWLAERGRPEEAQAERRAQAQADPRFRRGTALLDAGFRRESEEEFRDLLAAFQYDMVVVEHVAVHVRDRGFYPFSVTLGHRLFDSINQLGETSLLASPRVVQKLILPLAFLELVAPAAGAKHLDPLLLLGLIKQESYFEPRAQSSANARGLTQFIPSTARAVAQELNWPNWTWDDMNKPYVSVPFGAHYLSSLMRQFRGNYYFALAGYNGGPGNVLRWARGDWDRDVDLFVEGITYVETRGYVKLVAGNYELYKAIYYK